MSNANPPTTTIDQIARGLSSDAKRIVDAVRDDVDLFSTTQLPGILNDTALLNTKIQEAKAAGIKKLSGGSRKYVINQRLTIDSLILEDVQLELTGQGTVFLTGEDPGLRDFYIGWTAATGPNTTGNRRAAIWLHLSNNAYIGRGVLRGNYTASAFSDARTGIFSCTRASFTTVDEVVFHKCGFGILYNDQQGRTIDGVDYSGEPIGRGLYMSRLRYVRDPDGVMTGDAVEVNCPAERFADISADDVRVYGTNTSSNLGMGLGFAQCDTVRVSRGYVEDCASPAGAFHAEESTNVTFIDCTAIDPVCGYSLSTGSIYTVIGGSVIGAKEFSLRSQNTATGRTMRQLTINGVTFAGLLGRDGYTAFADIIMGNMANPTIQNCKFLGAGESGKPCIQVSTYDSSPTTDLSIIGNTFTTESGRVAQTLYVDDGSNAHVGYRSEGNKFPGLTSTAASFVNQMRARGVCRDTLRTANIAESAFDGADLVVGATPVGYITPFVSGTVRDVINGVTYRYDSVASAWSPVGKTWANPLRVGDGGIWFNANGRPLVRGTAGISSDSSGRELAVFRPVPADTSAAGFAGDIAVTTGSSGDRYLYIHNGTAWGRVTLDFSF